MRQYLNSPIIQRIVELYGVYFDSSYTVDGFYRDIWNLDTALMRGLVTWADIVAFDLNEYNSFLRRWTSFFGFATEDDAWRPFGDGVFFENEYILFLPQNGSEEEKTPAGSRELFRRFILGKAFANINAPTAKNINTALKMFFLDNAPFVVDGHDMTFRIMSPRALSLLERFFVIDVMARGSGVLLSIAENLKKDSWFGFEEGRDFLPFDSGAFYPEEFYYHV